MNQVITLDIGGSSVKSGRVTDDGTVSSAVIRTPIDNQASADELLQTFAAIIQTHSLSIQTESLAGIAIAIPGPFDYASGVSLIKGVAKFDALYGLNVRDQLQEILHLPDLPIVFCNDAVAAVVGEARFGAGKPFRRLLGLTLGTGLGSAFVVAGASVTEGEGIPFGGWLYPVLVDGVQADDQFSSRGLLAHLRPRAPELDTVVSFAQVARQGNRSIIRGFEDWGHNLGYFLTPFINGFAPNALLVLGGLAGAFDLFGAALQNAVSVPVLSGQLGATAPLLGVASFLFRQYNGNDFASG